MMDPLLDIPRIYTGIAEWVACYIYIAFAIKRFKGMKHYLLMAVSLIIIIGFQLIAGLLPIELWIPGMITAFLLMFLMVHTLANIKAITSLYFTIQAFVLAEFAASLEWQIFYYYANDGEKPLSLTSIILMVVIYSLIFTFTFFLEKRYRLTRSFIEIKSNDIYAYFVIAIAVFAISNLSFTNLISPFTGQSTSEIFYIRTLVDFVGILLLYSQREHKMSMRLKVEANAMEQLLKKQYEHFQSTQETMDMVNHKYHDLKHQLALIRLEEDHEKRNRYLDELENEIQVYGTNYQTGNQVLDTLLAIKYTKCINYDINLTVVADGKLLNFISIMDLSAILGNALDNAIENVINIEEKDKKLIKLAIFKRKKYLIIRIENYYEHRLDINNGQFVTTKEDKNTHGYGLKSIKHIVSKYGGHVSINTENQWFKLLIMIPLNQSK